MPVASGRGRFHRLRVASIEPLCADAAAITFDVPPDLAETFAFRPGQFLTVRRHADGVDERRSYSICAPAGSAPRIGLRHVPGGVVSGWLIQQVKAGDEIEVQAPAGTFTPDLAQPGHHVLIAAGSGITPVLSIAASVLADGESRVTLIYANRRSDSVMFADDVSDLKNSYMVRAEVIFLLSREAKEVDLFTGRLDAEKMAALLPAVCTPGEVDHWWLCGPYGMISDALGVLRAFGVPNDCIHRELFYVEEVAPEPVRHSEVAESGASVTVMLDGRASTATVAWDVSILEGVQRVRSDLPFACKGGVCGTCRAKLTEGEVTMRRNFALEPAEVEAGYVLTCQSVPVSDAVTVDYDA